MADANARLRITATDETRAAWESSIRQARESSQKISASIGAAFKGFAAGTAISALGQAITGAVTKTFELAESIQEGATKAGIATEEFSKLAFAAQQSNLSSDQLSSGISKLQVKLVEASRGSQAAADSFARLGLSAQSLRKLDTQGQLEAIADALQFIPDAANRSAAAISLLGESGTAFLEFFSEGSAGIRETADQAVRLGRILDAETAAAAKRAGDAVDALKAAAEGLGLKILRESTPALEGFADVLDRIANGGESSNLDTRIAELTEQRAELDRTLERFAKGNALGIFAGIRRDAENDLEDVKKKLAEAEALVRGREAGKPIEIERPPELSIPFTLPKLPDINKDIREQILADSFDDIARKSSETNERMRRIFEDLDRSVAEGAATVFESNEQAIAESLGRMDQQVFESLEVQRGLFEGFGEQIEGSLSDVFFNAGKGADRFADDVLNAFKRILADQAAQKTIQLIGGLFGGKKDPGVGGGGSGTAGILGTIAGAIFGGARADGGPVSSGMSYLVGERGPELFMPRQSGRIVPNGAIAGAGMVLNYSPVTNIDMRGSSNNEMASMLPAILKKNNEQQKNEIAQLIKRRQPPFV